LWFPPVEEAQHDGLLAMGGDLSPQRILLAYEKGIFPWFEGDTPLWWSPDPRFVLFPEQLKMSKSMRKLIEQNGFQFTINNNFEGVIHLCKTTRRNDQLGTWITDEVESAYINLHHLGYAFSAEAWQEGVLVGGLYGIKLGKVFFGESMFSTKSNASKYAFIQFVEHLKKEGIHLIDCQVYTNHLESLGANMITRNKFIELLKVYEAVR
jgi:leucyl/phenylalanyl-tRNA---protein transferase